MLSADLFGFETAVASTVLDRFVCCGAPTEKIDVVEPALFFHGGYGESRRTCSTFCGCGVLLARVVESTRPPLAG